MLSECKIHIDAGTIRLPCAYVHFSSIVLSIRFLIGISYSMCWVGFLLYQHVAYVQGADRMKASRLTAAVRYVVLVNQPNDSQTIVKR